MKKTITITLFSVLIVAVSIVIFAYARTWGKIDIEFRIHINKKLVQESNFGEPPTFAIWLEDPAGNTQTIFVTRRAAEGDWEGKADVPVALPRWVEVHKKEMQDRESPENKKPAPMAVTGATPKPGYFTTRVRVKPGSKWDCWIEVNLAGDFNEHYKEFDEVAKTTDEYAMGQPALLYKAEIEAVNGNVVKPEVVGMSILNSENGNIIQPVKGITTAANIFDEISVVIVRTNPKIIR